MDVILIWQ